MEPFVQNIYRDIEILARFIDAMEPLSGPSGYSLNIKYVADNSIEPPVIYVNVYEGADNCIYDDYVDQNTTLRQFERTIDRLRGFVTYCLKAIENKTSFSEEWRKAHDRPKDEVEDTPF